MSADYEARKRLTFEQAEGAEALPRQLRLKEISQEMRARLWAVIFSYLEKSKYLVHGRHGSVVIDPWNSILCRKHVFRDLQPIDQFDRSFDVHVDDLRKTLFGGTYIEVLGLIQWFLRDRNCPAGFASAIADALTHSQAAYAVFEADTIVPLASQAEGDTLKRAFADLSAAEFHGARAHLRNAGSKLTEEDWAGSIRESIHAVEAVARTLEPNATTLAPALVKLEKSVRVHPALSQGFGKLYGFTSDEKGIRHPLLDEAVAKVDETDALYILGSCAAFVSYLINKARTSGILKQRKTARARDHG